MRRRTVLVAVLLVLGCAGLSFVGSVVAVRAAGPAVTSFTLGRVETRVAPASSGRFDAYVPIVDWGVRARPYWAPLAVELQFRSLDRDAALAAVRSGPAAQTNVRLLEGELRESVDAGFRRAAAAGLVGGIVGGFIAGTIAVAFGRRRRWLPVGTATGVVTSSVAVVVAGLTLVSADWNALRQPTFYAHGSELPKLLSFSDQILTVGETYTDSYDRAVAGLENLISAPLMRALAREGVVVLTQAQGVVDVDGIAVAGFEDPLERDGGVSGHRLKLKVGEKVSAEAELISWFDALPRRPQVVLVHQHGLAHALLDHIAAEQATPPLLILTGHDHRQHVDRRGDDILVDGGTVGAGGPFAIGESPAGFALLHLTAANRLQAADLVQVEPLSGEGTARRVVFDPTR